MNNTAPKEKEEEIQVIVIDDNLNDKRYTEPFENDGAYADDEND